MKRLIVLSLVLVLLTSLPGSVTARSAASSSIPTFSIVSVEKDKTVTIKTYNFPANDSFTVTMGAYGTLGIGGVVVGTTSSGPGGTFTATYSIPASLAGSYRIAIRLQSYSSGYYAYNWFYNNTAAGSGSPGSGYSGYPTFAIVDVVRDSTVTIKTYNMPANDSFTVRMGAYGALGIGGVVVATTSSGAGGSFTATYNIPASLAGSYRIAIRMDSPTSGYYAYNWFYNNTVSAPPPGPTPTPGPTPAPGYSGYPTFSITAVVRDSTVTIQAYNLPPNDTFTVTMGPYGTLGIGGVVVTSTASGSGGSQSFTYNIPAALSGSYQIAIRLQSSTSGYYAYNWFYNNTTK